MFVLRLLGTGAKEIKKPGPKCFKDKLRKAKQAKVSLQVELSILTLRNTFNFGTARIQQGLINLPPYMREELPVRVQGVKLSRAAINNVLKKHGINGYAKKSEGWKFFRAEKPNELWQLDLKGPFKVDGKKYWFVICIDDYSRYLLLAEQHEHYPTVKEITSLLKPLVKKH